MQAARGASLSDADDHHGRHSTPTDGGGPRQTRSRAAAVSVFAAVAGVLLVVDQVTKAWAVAELSPGRSRDLVGELLQLTLVRNSGAAFGTGAGYTEVFTALAIAATVVTLWFALARTTSRLWGLAFGFLLAGVGGNLVDRLVRPPGVFRGHVIDFFQLPNWPVFNVADICINIAAVLILVLAWRGLPLSETPIETPIETPTDPAEPAEAPDEPVEASTPTEASTGAPAEPTGTPAPAEPVEAPDRKRDDR